MRRIQNLRGAKSGVKTKFSPKIALTNRTIDTKITKPITEYFNKFKAEFEKEKPVFRDFDSAKREWVGRKSILGYLGKLYLLLIQIETVEKISTLSPALARLKQEIIIEGRKCDKSFPNLI